ncbi:hypothetical protein KY290_021383 [Solanum tuberosum]|uniref:Uncharacterized protein n=1 Tax=Solanum tuberosum TaxID=4113 RepID=A0ABQ7V1D8_SOLTU|nr:hypothetical protein KY285_020310 [Solanum tuberosum]KAH0757890.1 hypothetical protein KY290_021383 [Solanum tuberosum]
MTERTQGEEENQLDIEELQNYKKAKKKSLVPTMSLNHFLEKKKIHVGEEEPYIQLADDVRSMPSPCINENNIEVADGVAPEEVGECVRDKDIDINCSKDGTIARNSRFITLLYTGWPTVPKDTKLRMWKYVNTKFIIPAEGEKWVMDGLRDAWRRHKRYVKENYFDKYKTLEDRLKNCPSWIPEVQFRQLIEYWELPTIKAMCSLNSQNRKKQKWWHRMGPVNFGRVSMALHATKENNEEP